LKERDLIDGIGVQGHNFEVNGGASISTLVNNLTNLANIGLPIFITEFDINEADDNTQLEKYQTIFPPIYEHPGVVGMTLWGYIQYQIWQTNAYLLDDRYDERPAMEWLRTHLQLHTDQFLFRLSERQTNYAILLWCGILLKPQHVSFTGCNERIFTNIVVDSVTASADNLRLVLSKQTQDIFGVSAINEFGESPFSPHEFFDTGEQTSDVEKLNGFPSEFSLAQNYPNPFNPITTIEFAVPFNSDVNIILYDVLGKEVGEILNGNYNQGYYKVDFNAIGLTSGIYFYRLQARGFISTKKITVLK
jgi:hypothetical protein